MKNQGESKNRNSTSDSLEFIHFTTDPIWPQYFSYLIEQHFMKFWKDKVLQNLGKLILLSKNLTGVPSVTGVHGALYGTWWCDPPRAVQ